jgi:hypothetical protein
MATARSLRRALANTTLAWRAGHGRVWQIARRVTLHAGAARHSTAYGVHACDASRQREEVLTR